MRWDDLKYFLELARADTLTTASRRIGVQHSTVARRISRFEREIGQPLFVRTQDGYRLNQAGHELMLKARDIEASIDAIAPKPQELNVSGLVRIGCGEGYGTYLIPHYLKEIRDLYKNIQIEIITLPHGVKISRNEADILITIDRPERGPYFFKKLIKYKLQLYASLEYISSSPPLNEPSDLAAHNFISYINDILPAKGIPIITEIPYAKHAYLRSSSLNVQKAAAQAGCGIALLPIFVVNEKEGLFPIFPDILSVTRTYWMMRPIELQKANHVQLVWDVIAAQARNFEEF